MDTLRKFFASVSATVLLVSSIVTPSLTPKRAYAQEGHWAYDACLQLVDEGVVTADFCKDLNKPAKRWELAALVMYVGGLVGAEEVADSKSTGEVAVENGVLKGQNNDPKKLGLDDNVNRAEATVIGLRVFEAIDGYPAEGSLPDLKGDEWYAESTQKLVRSGGIKGKTVNGKRVFAASDAITRGEAIYLALQFFRASESITVWQDAGNEGAPELEAIEEFEIVGVFSGETELVFETVKPGPEPTPDPGVEPTPAPAAGSIVFSLEGTPEGSTIPLGARGVPYMQFRVKAADGEANLDAIKFSRTGVGTAGDFANVYLYEGAVRLKSGKTISADTNTVEFTGLALKVDTTGKLITVRVDILAAAVANNQHTLSIAAAKDVSSTAGATTGLPISSSKFSIGAVAVGAVTLAVVSTISGPTLGATNAECGNVRVTGGGNDIQIVTMTITHGGTISRSNLKNFKLVQPGFTDTDVTDGVIASAETINEKDRLVFVLKKPFKISKNQNRNFEIRCDVLGGKTTDNLRFYLDETTDADITDLQYGYGSNITNNFALANVVAVALQGGKLTFADNGPVAQNLATNTTLQKVFNFTVTAGRSVTVRDFWLLISQQTWDGVSALRSGELGASDLDVGAITAAGAATFQTDANEAANLAVNDVLRLAVDTVTAGTAGTFFVRVTAVPANSDTTNITATLIYPSTTLAAQVTWADDGGTNAFSEVFDAHLQTRVKNVKLLDTETGATIASVADSRYAMAFSDDFDIGAGKARKLAVVVDLDTTLTAANAFQGGIDFDDAGFVRDNDANENLAAADIVGGAIFGKTMTVVAASLTVSIASTPVSETHVRGESNMDVAGFSLRAGDGGNVKVTRVDIRLLADDDSTTDFIASSGDTAANTVVTSVGLYKVDGSTYTRIGTGDVGMTLVGTIGVAGGYYRAQFLNLTESIAKSTTAKWVVKVNLSNTSTATRFLAAGIDADTDILAQDADGNTVTPTGNNLNIAVAPTVVKTINTGGTLAATEQSSPNAKIITAGASDNVAANIQWSATSEAFKVTKLDVALPEGVVATDPFDYDTNQAATTAVARSIVRVKARYLNSLGATETKEGGYTGAGVWKFTGLDLLIGKNTTANMEILTDLSTIAAGAVTGDTIRLGIYTGNGGGGAHVAGAYTFEAIGQGSSTSLTTLAPTNMANINSHVLRKAQPIVAKAATGLPTSLTNGTVKVYGLTVKADGGPISLKRLVFTLNTSVDAGDTMSQFKLFRGSQDLSTNVSIRTKYGTDAESTTDITGGNTTVSEILSVHWDDATTREETISSGVTNTYYLEASVSGASTGNNLSVNLADDTVQMAAGAGVDEFAGTASHQGNIVVWRIDAGANAAADTIYADLNGDGAYTAAADYLFTAANMTDLTTQLADHVYIGGRIGVFANATAADGTDDLLYWDINANGVYNANVDPSIVVGAIAEPTTAANALDADTYLTTQTIRSETAGCTGAYIDANTGAGTAGVFDAANDYCLTMTQTTTALAEDTELQTANMNFVWSDQGEASGTVHATTTTAWTNGLNVDNLATGTLSLSF